ncbi:MAG: divergent polysaccharide deacetylase family protein [Pikeienuella sp.]|uniref:divergent polysaccharide deacetylase family protein n=1 Tax=Pikeienuella sp. TaxID=2831957 RepID=UPI00391CF4DA
MAEGMSGRGAYWLGAFTGLVFSAAVGAALSIWAPQTGAPGQPVEMAAAPAPEPDASDAAADPAPVAEPAETPVSEAAPEPGPAPEPAAPTPAAAGDAPPPVSAEADPAPEADASPVAAAPGAPPPPAEPEPAAPALGEAAAPPAATVGALEEAPPVSPEEPEEPATPAPAATDALAEAPAAAESPAPDVEAATEADAAEVEPGPPGLALNRAPFDGEADAPILVVALSGVDEAALEDAMRLPFPVTLLLSVEGEAGARLAAAAQAAGLETVSPSAPGDVAGPVIGVALSEAPADRAAFFAALAARDLALLDISAPGGSAEFRMARAAGLQAAALGLRIDEIANSEIVYQSLERAALEARKRGVFIAVGEANQAVLAGLRRWMSVKAGKTIDLAPLSAAIDRTPAR